MGKHRNDIWYIFVIALAMISVGLFSGGSINGYQIVENTTPLENAIDFLRRFGFFSVILPFLLTFSIVFGVLEKSKLFGTEKIDGKDYPKRNINSVVAFCVAFFVVAASNITGLIQATIPQIALVLLIIIVFLLLFGSLMGSKTLEKGGGVLDLWAIAPGISKVFIVAIFVAMILIILGAFGINLFDYVFNNISGTFITIVIFFLVMILAIWFIARSPKGESK